ncbi:MAG: hypothetical protein ACRCWJ_03225, partial [Casimicrobium sp.]
ALHYWRRIAWPDRGCAHRSGSSGVAVVTRSDRAYADRSPFVAPEDYGVSLDPVAGFYRGKMRSGGALCGFYVWFGPPLDPVTGKEMDRGHRWQAHCNGEYVEIDDVWPQVAGEPITRAVYVKHCELAKWAKQNAPQSALANPKRKADPIHSPLYF